MPKAGRMGPSAAVGGRECWRVRCAAARPREGPGREEEGVGVGGGGGERGATGDEGKLFAPHLEDGEGVEVAGELEVFQDEAVRDTPPEAPGLVARGGDRSSEAVARDGRGRAHRGVPPPQVRQHLGPQVRLHVVNDSQLAELRVELALQLRRARAGDGAGATLGDPVLLPLGLAHFFRGRMEI